MVYRGSRGPRKTKKWEPKTWHPKYDIIVTLYCAGTNQTKIGKLVGMTQVAVNIILVSKKGKEEIAIARAKQQRLLNNKNSSRLDKLQEQALTNIERVISDPILLNENPFAVFNASLALSRGMGKFIEDKNKGDDIPLPGQQNNFFINNPDAAGKIVEGLSKVMEVKQLHSGKDG